MCLHLHGKFQEEDPGFDKLTLAAASLVISLSDQSNSEQRIAIQEETKHFLLCS